MIKVSVFKQGNYPIKSPVLKERIRNFFRKQGIISDSFVSVALVGENKMLDIAEAYMDERSPHNVLAFPESEARGNFVYPPDGFIHLGEIIICYPKAFEEAKKEGMLIEEKIGALLEHGGFHLLGIHHEE